MRKKKLIVALCIHFLFYAFVAVAQKPSPTDYCHFKGTINGNLPIVMDLIRSGNIFSGSYYYTKYNLPIYLDGNINKQGEIELYVTDDEGEKIEFITGKINQDTFVGTWQNKEKTKKLPISLVEDYSKSINFEITVVEDSIKLFKNKKETPQAVFSEVIIDVKQVPQESNLSKIKEILKKHQSVQDSESSTANLTPKQIAENNKKSFFKEYVEVNKDQEEEYLYAANWTDKSYVEVIFNDYYFTTIAFSNYMYLGGAHGMYGKTYLVIDVKNGKEIKLNDLFEKQSLATLEKRIIKKAYAYTSSENATSLQDAGYLVDKIEVTENFSLTPKGITFAYQPYEIAPYALGMPTFLFTWEEIEELIKPDSPINSFFKKQ